MRKYRAKYFEKFSNQKSKGTFEHGTGDRVIDERLKLKLPQIYVAKD